MPQAEVKYELDVGCMHMSKVSGIQINFVREGVSMRLQSLSLPVIDARYLLACGGVAWHPASSSSIVAAQATSNAAAGSRASRLTSDHHPSYPASKAERQCL